MSYVRHIKCKCYGYKLLWANAGTCARGRRALQQLALNVHVEHSDLT